MKYILNGLIALAYGTDVYSMYRQQSQTDKELSMLQQQ